MYTNTTGTPQQGMLSAALVQTLKAQVLAITVAGQSCAGFSDQATAQYLNAPVTLPNPQTDLIAALVIPAQHIRLVLDNLLSAVELIPTTDSRFSIYTNRLNFLAANLSTDVPTGEPQLQRLLSQMVADATLTPQQAARALYVPDPTWQATVQGESWALRNLSCWLEAADITTAKAS